jgi:hypothetical protein
LDVPFAPAAHPSIVELGSSLVAERNPGHLRKNARYLADAFGEGCGRLRQAIHLAFSVPLVVPHLLIAVWT